MLLEQAVDKDVAAADFAEQDAVGGVVKEANPRPGQVARAPQRATQRVMQEHGAAAKEQPGAQPRQQPHAQALDPPERRPTLADRQPETQSHPQADQRRGYQRVQQGIARCLPYALVGRGPDRDGGASQATHQRAH